MMIRLLSPLLLFLGSGLFPLASAAESRPNILILYADDMGYGDLSIQKNNVAKDQPEKVKELQDLLKKIRQQGHSAPRLSSTNNN